jgi:hypothetical protein
VTAPGYQPWENAIRAKLNENRPIEITVKMKRMAGLERQGLKIRIGLAYLD